MTSFRSHRVMDLGGRSGFLTPRQGLWVSLKFSPGASWSFVYSILSCPPGIQRGFLQGHHVIHPLLQPCKGPTGAGHRAQILSDLPACANPLAVPLQSPHQSLHSHRPSCQVCSHLGTFAQALLSQSQIRTTLAEMATWAPWLPTAIGAVTLHRWWLGWVAGLL